MCKIAEKHIWPKTDQKGMEPTSTQGTNRAELPAV